MMSEAFSRLKSRRSKLPEPPTDVTNNLAAPEVAPADPSTRLTRSLSSPDMTPEPDPPKPRIDGRTRLRKDRTEALSTKIKPHHRDLLMSLADAYDATLSETLERAIEALEAQARREGRVGGTP